MPECETCEFASYDEATGELICEADLDEDEFYKLLTDKDKRCRFYKNYDEYKTVRKQN